jgi:hypothetical protein
MKSRFGDKKERRNRALAKKERKKERRNRALAK